MAGTIKLDGTTFLSKSGSDFTVDVGTDGSYANGSINSNVTFPAGHIVSHATPYYDQSVASDISTNQTSFQESGIEVSLTTKYSSSNSRIIIQFHSGFMRMSGSSAICRWTVGRATSSSSAIGSATNLSDSDSSSQFYPDATGAYWSQGGLWIDTGSYSASTTYYYQVYFSSASGTTNLVKSGALVALNAYEVRIS